MATFLYNPDRKPKGSLIAEFVVRTGIYEEIMHDLQTSKMKHPEQHYLLVGQRGAGKTTLLNRIKYGIEDSAILKEKVIPILFSEEQYNISELVNLWEAIAQYLEDYHELEGLYEEIEGNLHKANFEELSYDILEKHLKSSRFKLVLLIDNIGDLLKKMEKTEIHRLREILQTKSEIRLIAGSPFYLETVLDYQQPLFEFFKVLRLDGLNKDETQSLLLKLAQMNGEDEKIRRIIKETPERIETLRTLTGGVPRTIALMYNIFVEYNNQDTIKDLEKILDAVTPLYKHRMDDLPTQQQKIVDAVGKNWDGISVKELKEKLRIESKIISAQLRQLQKNQVIAIVETGTKNNLYFLAERFFNIWYLMRYGRKHDKQRVIWLVKFLESWCTINEIEERIIDYVRKIQEGGIDEPMIAFYGEVYTAIEKVGTEVKVILRKNTPIHLSKRISIANEEILQLAINYVDIKEFDKAFDLLDNISNLKEEQASVIASIVANLAKDEINSLADWAAKVIDRIEPKEIVEASFFDQIISLVVLFSSTVGKLMKSEHELAHKHLKTMLWIASGIEDDYKKIIDVLLTQAFILFLSAEQGNSVLSIFEASPIWKDKLSVIYYANLVVLGKENETLKMPPEIKNSVNEVVAEIETSKINFFNVLTEN